MKRKPLSARKSRRIFKKGSKVNRKNGMPSGGTQGVMRGGIRL